MRQYLVVVGTRLVVVVVMYEDSFPTKQTGALIVILASSFSFSSKKAVLKIFFMLALLSLQPE